MSAFGFIYDEFKKDGFEPRLECVALGIDDDLGIILHQREVPECMWFVQWQRRNWPMTKRTVPYWNPAPRAWGVWMLI